MIERSRGRSVAIAAERPRALRVVDPATLETVAEVPSATPDDARAAYERARAAQPAWAALPLRERAAVLRRLGEIVLRERDALARLVCREMGKPVPEALAADVLPVLDAIRYVTSRRARGFLEPRARHLSLILVAERTSRVVREPLGVVGIVSPWNYPLGIPGSQIVFALVCGDGVVLKPASRTPLVMLRFAELLREAGVPEGLVHVVPGSGATVGAALASLPFDHVIFTGGEEGGRDVARACAARGSGCTLELGGSDPALVLADADLDTAANGVVWARFANAGQTCAAVKRVFVEEAVAERFTQLVVGKVRNLRVGNGLDATTDMGPLVEARAVEEMEAVVRDATARGARVLVGGERLDRPGHFFAPTVLADVPADARALREEVFGPVLPIVRVRDEEEAIRLANSTAFGLSASVWTRDRTRAQRVAARLEAGSVWINDHTYTYAIAETPWGGVKSSGAGHTHGEDGLAALTRAKHVNRSPARRAWPNVWWFPYDAGTRRVWRDGLPFLYGRGLRRFLPLPRIALGILRKKLL